MKVESTTSVNPVGRHGGVGVNSTSGWPDFTDTTVGPGRGLVLLGVVSLNIESHVEVVVCNDGYTVTHAVAVGVKTVMSEGKLVSDLVGRSDDVSVLNEAEVVDEGSVTFSSDVPPGCIEKFEQGGLTVPDAPQQ